jgi:hypothetical protein
MEEGVLWRADVMEGPCAVARGKDMNTHFCDCRTAVSEAKRPLCVSEVKRDVVKNL